VSTIRSESVSDSTERTPTYLLTDLLTNEESLSPTRDNNSSVTRTRTYGDESLADPIEDAPRPGWFTCRICVPNVHERGGMDAFYAHYLATHYLEVKP
jgi:hypothetical protein